MLGCLSRFLDFTIKDWEESISKFVKESALEQNIKAFKMGRELIA